MKVNVVSLHSNKEGADWTFQIRRLCYSDSNFLDEIGAPANVPKLRSLRKRVGKK